jgi:transposase
VPWARPRSDFTLLFEALVMALVAEMPVKPVAELVGEHEERIWRIVEHYVGGAVEAQDLSGTERVGIDDTSFRRGQSYVSVFCDLGPDERRAVLSPRRDQQTSSNLRGFWPATAAIASGSRRSARTCRRPTWLACATT